MDDLIGTITDATIDHYRNAPASVVVFGIAHCDGCMLMDGVLSDLAPRWHDRVRFGKAKMHVPGACRDIKKRYTFDTYPTTHLYAQGQLIERKEGAVAAADLEHAIQTLLLKN